MSKNIITTIKPLIFNVFKSRGMTSYDVIRHFKKNLPIGFGKIGHIGTLDPFASGVLLIGVGGATKLNDYIHKHCPKRYLAIGKLGMNTETGDNTSPVSKVDESDFLKIKIASMDSMFIEKKLQNNFSGDYMQAPHKYSAAKFEGRKLYEYARDGVVVKKKKVLRTIYDLKVVKYKFPYLSIEVSVSSGTYIRSLFSEFANYLGTYGHLVGLQRTAIGDIISQNSLRSRNWPYDRSEKIYDHALNIDEVLKYPKITLAESEVLKYQNGIPYNQEGHSCEHWITDQNANILGLGNKVRFPFSYI